MQPIHFMRSLWNVNPNSKNNMKKFIFTIYSLTLVFCALAQQTVEKSFSDIKDIRLTLGSADCEVTKSNDGRVHVSVEYTYTHYKPVMKQRGGQLTLEEDFQKRNGGNNGNSDWTISIPDDLELKITTGSGEVFLEGITLELAANTGSGTIEARQAGGEFSINAGSGKIVISDFEGEASANAGSGTIEVSGANGEMKLNCGSGKIKLEMISGAISANVGSGNITGRNIAITEKSSFNSGSGDVEVKFSATPIADVSANSGSGNAEIDFNGNDIAGTVVMKANKRNGKISSPLHFDKEEEIEEGRNTIIKKTAVLSDADITIRIGTGSGTAKLTK